MTTPGRVDELIEGPESERNGRLGPRECGSNIALHRRALAGSRVDGQEYGWPAWAQLSMDMRPAPPG